MTRIPRKKKANPAQEYYKVFSTDAGDLRSFSSLTGFDHVYEHGAMNRPNNPGKFFAFIDYDSALTFAVANCVMNTQYEIHRIKAENPQQAHWRLPNGYLVGSTFDRAEYLRFWELVASGKACDWLGASENQALFGPLSAPIGSIMCDGIRPLQEIIKLHFISVNVRQRARQVG